MVQQLLETEQVALGSDILSHYFRTKKKKKLEISAVGCLGVGGYLTSHHSSAAERRRWWQIGTECDMLLGEDYVAPAGGRAHSDG